MEKLISFGVKSIIGNVWGMSMKKLFAALIGLLIIGAVIAAFPLPLPGIQLTFVDEKGRPLTEISENAEVQIQIDALVPTNEIYRTAYYGTLKKPSFLKFWDKGNTLKLSPKDGVFKEVIAQWNTKYPEGIDTSLVVSVWVFDYKTGKLYRGFSVVNYNTKEIETGLKRVVRIDINKLPVSTLPKGVSPTSSKHFYYWKTDWSLSWRPTNYVEVPVLIIKNKYSYSGRISAWVNLIKEEYTRFDYTFAYGYKISERDSPSLDVYSGGYTIRKRLEFTDNILVNPNKAGYIYIMAKPFHLHQKEYHCVGSLNRCTPTGEERVQEGIWDIEVNKNEIIGGSKNSLPPSNIMNQIYAGTNLRYWGGLNVDESVSLGKLFNDIGSCSFGFGFGVPVGALAVALSGGAVPPWAAGLAVGIHHDSTGSIQVYGGIKNHGRDNGIGYNVDEYLYIAVSGYTHKIGGCDTKVPVGIYIESR